MKKVIVDKGTPSPTKDVTKLSDMIVSVPTSGPQRRLRNQRSTGKSVKKPRMSGLEPFKDKTDFVANSPT